MKIDFDSAQISVDVNGSAPDTDISSDGQWAVLHLTRNADPIIAGNKRATDVEVSAINISGLVDVHSSPSEDISKIMEFRFVQLAQHAVEYSLYAGSAPNEGFLSINAAAPPAFPQKFAYDFVIDAGPEFFGREVMPFTNLRNPTINPKRKKKGELVPGVSTVITDMDDHPSLRLKLAFQNRETNKPNFLVEVTRETSFLTAFVIRDRQKKITIMAHVCWYALWKARYHWVGGNCIPYRPMVGRFDVGKVIKGAPTGSTMGKTGSSLADKVTNPNMDPNETANALTRAAHRNLDAHPLFWNVTYGQQWPAQLASDFWAR